MSLEYLMSLKKLKSSKVKSKFGLAIKMEKPFLLHIYTN